MKKYSLEIKMLLVAVIVLYVLPINIYFISDFNSGNYSNLLYVINPIAFFLISIVEGSRRNNFYVFPLVLSSLYIPLTFTIYPSKYLSLFFLYLVISLVGGLFGVWMSDKEDVRKSFKKAVGIMCVIGAIFAFALTIVDFIFKYCKNGICEYQSIFSLANIEIIIFIIICFFLGRYCLKKKKKD